MLLHYSTHKVFTSQFKSSEDDCSQLATHELPAAVSHRELTRKRASVSSINPWCDTLETLLPTVLQLLRHCWNAWRHCWHGHLTPPHSCVIQVFIAVAWHKRGEAMESNARRCSTRHSTAELGSARRKYHFVYCCVIAGTCFDVTVLAWRKYGTILKWILER
jgi:hypothetical protein